MNALGKFYTKAVINSLQIFTVEKRLSTVKMRILIDFVDSKTISEMNSEEYSTQNRVCGKSICVYDFNLAVDVDDFETALIKSIG